MSGSAVEARRKQFAEKLDAPPPRFGARRDENTYTRFNPVLMLGLALAVCVGVAAVYRGGGHADHHELAVRLTVGFLIWAVPVALVVLPVAVRHLARRRALRATAAAVAHSGPGVPAAVDGTQGLLLTDGPALTLLTPGGGSREVAAYAAVAAVCEFTPRHPLWSLPGADLRLADGRWVEIRAVDVRPLLTACAAAGVRVLPAVNVADLRTWGRPAA